MGGLGSGSPMGDPWDHRGSMQVHRAGQWESRCKCRQEAFKARDHAAALILCQEAEGRSGQGCKATEVLCLGLWLG